LQAIVDCGFPAAIIEVYSVKGMTCNSCVQAVTQALLQYVVFVIVSVFFLSFFEKSFAFQGW